MVKKIALLVLCSLFFSFLPLGLKAENNSRLKSSNQLEIGIRFFSSLLKERSHIARLADSDKLLVPKSNTELYHLRIKLNNPSFANFSYAPNPYNKSLVSIFQVDDSPKTVANLMYPYLKGGTTAGGYESPGVKSTDGCGNELFWTISVACFVSDEDGNDLLAANSPYISWQDLVTVTANGPGLQRGFDFDNHGFGGSATLQKDRSQQILLNNLSAYQNLGFQPEALVVPDVQIGYRFGANDFGMDVTSQAGVESLWDGKSPMSESASAATIYANVANPYFFRRNHWQEINSPALVTEHKQYVLDAYNKSLTQPGIYNWFSHGPGEMGTSNFAYYREVIDYMRELAGDDVIGLSLSQYLGYQKTRYAAEQGAMTSSTLSSDGYLDITFDMSSLQKTVRNRLLTLLVNSDAEIESVSWSENIKAVTFNPESGLVNVQLNETESVDPATLASRPRIIPGKVEVKAATPDKISFELTSAITQSNLAAYDVEGNTPTALTEVPGSNGRKWELSLENEFLSTDVVTLSYKAELGNALDVQNGTKMLGYFKFPVINGSERTAAESTPLAISIRRDSDNIQLATFNTIAELKTYMTSFNFNTNISIIFNNSASYSLSEKWHLNYNNGPYSLTIKGKDDLTDLPVIDAMGTTSDVIRVGMNHVRIAKLKLRSGKYTSDGAAFGDNYSGAIISQQSGTSDVAYTNLVLHQGMRGLRIGASNGSDPSNISNVIIDGIELTELTGIAIQVGFINNSPSQPANRPDSYYSLNNLSIRNIKLRDTKNTGTIESSNQSYYGQIHCRGVNNLVIQDVDAFQNQKQPFYIVNSKNVLIDRCRASQFSLNTGTGYKAAFYVESSEGIRIQNSYAKGPFENVYVSASTGIKLYHNTFDSREGDARTVSLHNVSSVMDIQGNLIASKGNAPWYSCLGGSFNRSNGHIPSLDTDFLIEKNNLFITSSYVFDFAGLSADNSSLIVRSNAGSLYSEYQSLYSRGQGSAIFATGLAYTERNDIAGYLDDTSVGRHFISSLIDTLNTDLNRNNRTFPADVGALDWLNAQTTVQANAAKSELGPLQSEITADGLSRLTLTVTVKDASGNPLSSGGDEVVLEKISGQGLISEATDHGNGTYTAFVTAPALAGEAFFSARINGEPVQNGLSDQAMAQVTFKAAPNHESVFPERISFKNTTATDFVLGGNPIASLTSGSPDPEGAGYLRLTNNQANQSGFARSTRSFPANRGLNLNFEYYTYGGSGGDGLTFFLYDPSASPFNPGAAGGSLGYAQTTNNGGLPGLSKAYLGIGLDEFGNFSNPTAGRQGGPGFRPGSITLRGDGNGASTSADNYEYLSSLQTNNATAMTAAGAGTPFPLAGMVNGRSTFNSTRPEGGLTRFDSGYRKLRAELLPNQTLTGYLINVWITEGSTAGGIEHKVINDFEYIGNTMPSELSYGFVSSTGGSNNYHEIRNLEVLVPNQYPLPPTTGLNQQVKLFENSSFNFLPENFYLEASERSAFKDPNGDALAKIRIESLPAHGALLGNGLPVQSGSEIMYSQLAELQYVPDSNFNGLDSITWKGADPGGQFAANASTFGFEVLSSKVEVVATINENEEFSESNGIAGLTYILEGPDAFRFSVNSSTGVLKMPARNFEHPADADSNNVYEVTVKRIYENGQSFSRNWKISVGDIQETAEFTLASVLLVGIEENQNYLSEAPEINGNTIGGNAPRNFSIIPIPDTQFYTGELNGGSNSIFKSQTSWIMQYLSQLNAQYAVHLGDQVENGDNNGNDVEWRRADTAMRILETASPVYPNGLPYGMNVGNHDQTPFNAANGSTALYNQYFGTARFAGRSYYGGQFGDNNDNNYQLFTTGGLEFIAINLEFDPAINQEVLDWADNLLKSNPNRRGIISSHALLNANGTYSQQGQATYDRLKANPNLFLMLTGHVSAEAKRTDQFNDNTVHTLLSDYQGRPKGGEGWLRIMEFMPSENKIWVRTYSPFLNKFETDEDSEFMLSYAMSKSSLPGSLTYTLAGPDAALFSVNSQTGVIAMTARDFNNPEDANGDNLYEVQLIATDEDENTASQIRQFRITKEKANARLSVISPLNSEMEAYAESTTEFTLQAKKADGSLMTEGGSEVILRLISGSMQPVPVEDMGDGTYTFNLTASSTPGLNVFSIDLDGKPVMNGGLDTAKLNVTLVPSDDASLAALELDGLTISPAFSPEAYSYLAEVSAETDFVALHLRTSNRFARLKLGNESLAVDTTVQIHLNPGLNTLIIEVKAQDGASTEIYDLSILRRLPIFPHYASFTGSTEAGMVFGGLPISANLTAGTLDEAGSGYLRLTSNAANQSGFARNTTRFPSKNGLSVSFEYFTYGGSGGDGLSFYLFDANVNPFQVGAPAGSLGYAQTSNSGGIAGLSKGFLGVGIDEFGNFSNSNAGRQGGPGQRSSSLTLRGDGDGKALNATNYEYLTSMQTTNASAMSMAGAGEVFPIAGMVNPRSASGLIPISKGYRKMKLTMRPNGLNTGFYIDAWITEGNVDGPILHKLIDNYHYIPHGTIPDSLNYGFAAATGGYNNVHEIRNLEITLPGQSSQPGTVENVAKTGSTNTDLYFTSDDFAEGFSSPTGGALTKIKILALPSQGLLSLGDSSVAAFTEIGSTQLEQLKYTPPPGFMGGVSFSWTASDAAQYASGSAIMEITIKSDITAMLPYTESFRYATAPGLIMGGTPSAMLTASSSGIDLPGAGYLRLTSNLGNQNGYVRNMAPFPLREGLDISFEYYSYGGSGGDGMSFFLYDASANHDFRIGAPGGSLGYAQNWSEPGVSKGYIGFGFDEFGNFSTASAGRQGGPGQKPSSLTLRGDGDGAGSGSPGGTNYEFLKNVQTSDATMMNTAEANGTFLISGNVNGRLAGAEGLNSAQSGYRKARIKMIPSQNGTGYIINVWITEGAETGGKLHHLVSDFNYTGNSHPEFVSYGFSAATGGVNNYHEIRNLSIMKPELEGQDFLMTTREDAFGGNNGATAILYENQIQNELDQDSEAEPTNLMTPNGDGRNDTWVIRNIAYFPENSVQIFDRRGQKVYQKTNYGNDWDGTSGGVALDAGTYYYILELKGKKDLIKGYVNILR